MRNLLWIPCIVAVAMAACSSTDTTNGGNGTTTAGASKFVLIDDPFPFSRVARVDLYVVSVQASVNGDTSAAAGGDFVTVATPHRSINLLALQNGTSDVLGSFTLPNGAITAVRLTIDTDSSSITLKDGRVLTATSTPGIHWQSSAGRPVLNAMIERQIVVPDSGTTVVIDFDVGQAFITPQTITPGSTDSGFVFSPVFKALDATRSGAVTGIARAHSTGGAPVADASVRLYLGDPSKPEGTWSTMGTARSDSTGMFRFSYVTPTSRWDGTALAGFTYMVAIDPPVGAGLTRNVMMRVPVTARSVTDVGALALP